MYYSTEEVSGTGTDGARRPTTDPNSPQGSQHPVITEKRHSLPIPLEAAQCDSGVRDVTPSSSENLAATNQPRRSSHDGQHPHSHPEEHPHSH